MSLTYKLSSQKMDGWTGRKLVGLLDFAHYYKPEGLALVSTRVISPSSITVTINYLLIFVLKHLILQAQLQFYVALLPLLFERVTRLR